MSLINVTQQPLSMRPLGQNNSQTPGSEGPKITTKMGTKVKAKADSTGIENNMIIKHHHSVKKAQTASVAKRNLRERTRVRGVNDGFGKLKLYVPDMKSKSSKVETLRGAIDYIKRLKELLGEEIDNTSSGSFKFEDDSINDDSSTFSDITDSSFSTSNSERSPDLSEVNLNSMVYRLPTPSPYHIPNNSSYILPLSPITLPPVSTLSPNQSRLTIITANPPANETSEDKSLVKLPPMSINAPSWWPQK